MPAIVCDSSSLISFSSSCLVDALRFAKRELRARFFVTPEVKNEIVTRPLGIPEYEFSALRLKKLVDDRVLDVISTPNLVRVTKKLLWLANNLFTVGGKPLEILHEGETECLAVFEGMSAGALLVDEKTTRMLLEGPHLLHEIMKTEYPRGVALDEGILREWREATKGIFVMRSTELLALAAERGFFSEYGPEAHKATHAALLSLRSSGCSLTSNELREYGQMRV